MISASKRILLFIFASLTSVFAQSTLEQQFKFANQLFTQQKYFDAITELKRLQFFDIENKFSFRSNLLIGISYKAGAKFDEAIKLTKEMSPKNLLNRLPNETADPDGEI